MGKLSFPEPTKLIIGLIFKDGSLLIETQNILRRHFGNFDYESAVIPFIYTDYYEKEFGKDLKRKFLSFEKLIHSEKLSRIKNLTNKIETKFYRGKLRRINIDPGYLTLAKLVLASTKDYNHRIYLNNGIFAEITLSYQNKSFRPREWTYPDYRSCEYIEIFLRIRNIYALQIKRISNDRVLLRNF